MLHVHLTRTFRDKSETKKDKTSFCFNSYTLLTYHFGSFCQVRHHLEQVTPFISGQNVPIDMGMNCFPPIIHQLNAECDPACEYLTAVHALLICISLFFLSCLFSPSVVRFQEFPLGVVQVLRPRKKAAFYFLFFFTFFVLPPPDHLMFFLTTSILENMFPLTLDSSLRTY